MSHIIIKEGLSFDPAVGVFVWVNPPHNNQALVGKRAGTRNLTGYRRVWFGGKRWNEHRLAWLFVYGVEPPDTIDHINGIRDDNRIANLRLATRYENARNRVVSKNNKLGIKGVCWKPLENKFVANIRVNGKNRHLGYFHTIEAAAAAYNHAAAEHHGDFAKVAA